MELSDDKGSITCPNKACGISKETYIYMYITCYDLQKRVFRCDYLNYSVYLNYAAVCRLNNLQPSLPLSGMWQDHCDYDDGYYLDYLDGFFDYFHYLDYLVVRQGPWWQDHGGGDYD